MWSVELYPTFWRNVSPPSSGSKNSSANQRASNPEDGGDTFLRNVEYNSTDYTTSYPRKRYSSIVNTVGEVEGTKDSLGSRSYYYNLHSV
jgi:hypothetical protein